MRVKTTDLKGAALQWAFRKAISYNFAPPYDFSSEQQAREVVKDHFGEVVEIPAGVRND